MRDNLVSVIACAALTAVFGFTWYFNQGAQYDGWNLFATVLCGLNIFNGVSALANGERMQPPEKNEKND